MALALNNLTKVDMPLNKETKPNLVFHTEKVMNSTILILAIQG